MGIQPWDPKYYQEKIVELEGRFYWDRKYENYQVVLEEENDGEGVGGCMTRSPAYWRS